ncbi:hypothetical protein EC988_006115, partial [Linderina pennispora]
MALMALRSLKIGDSELQHQLLGRAHRSSSQALAAYSEQAAHGGVAAAAGTTKAKKKSRSQGRKSGAVDAIAQRIVLDKLAGNALIWVINGECLIHLMLGFALRQETQRHMPHSHSEVRLVEWLIFAQLCMSLSWLRQLKRRFKVRPHHISQPPANPSFLWTWGREGFWTFALLASGAELLAYIKCTPAAEAADMEPATQSLMLLTLISIRILVNCMLVGCALYGLVLHRRQLVNICARNTRLAAATETAAATAAAAVAEAHASGAARHSFAQVVQGDSCGSMDTINIGVECQHTPSQYNTLHSDHNHTGAHSGSTETTPLLQSTDQPPIGSRTSTCSLSATPEDAAQSASKPSGRQSDGENDDDEHDSDALRSGVKKVKMYHQSEELDHDIIGLQKRMAHLWPFLWP